jgi:hypothetical protein
MKKIKNIEKITTVCSSWKPSDIAFIKSLELSADNLVITFYSQLRNSVMGWPDSSKDFFEVVMTFKNITNLKLDFVNPSLQQVTGFDIQDISDNGLEKINFLIEDYENGIISFSCEDIEVNDLSEKKPIFF